MERTVIQTVPLPRILVVRFCAAIWRYPTSRRAALAEAISEGDTLTV